MNYNQYHSVIRLFIPLLLLGCESATKSSANVNNKLVNLSIKNEIVNLSITSELLNSKVTDSLNNSVFLFVSPSDCDPCNLELMQWNDLKNKIISKHLIILDRNNNNIDEYLEKYGFSNFSVYPDTSLKFAPYISFLPLKIWVSSNGNITYAIVDNTQSPMDFIK